MSKPTCCTRRCARLSLYLDADLEAAGDLVQSCYTKDGTTSLDAISPTLNNLQDELGVSGPLPELPLLEPAD